MTKKLIAKRLTCFLAVLTCTIAPVSYFNTASVRAASSKPAPASALAAASVSASEANWVNWIKNNHHDIKSLDSTDYSDLDFLKPILKDKQVVFLGESFHGVSDYETIKVRLIKYLHEKMGFNVLAFESDLGTCSAVSDDIKNLTPLQAMQNGILGIWSTKATLPLFQYMQKEANSKNKLNLTGFDMQPTNLYDGDYFTNYAYEMLRTVDKHIAMQYLKFEFDYLNTVLQLSQKYGDAVPSSEINPIRPNVAAGYNMFLKYISANRAKFVKLNGEKKVELCEREMAQRVCSLDMMNCGSGKDNGIFEKESYEYRDKIMEQNLEWIMQKQYPGQKIIVWEHNEHMSKNTSKGTYVSGKTTQVQFMSMGEMFNKKFGAKAYHLALYLNKGTAAEIGTLKPYTIAPMPAGTCENLFAKAGCKNVFVDLSSQKTKTSGNSWMFSNMLFGEDGMTGTKIQPASLRIVPKEQYDGILYLDQVHAPEFLFGN